jgi:bifunctional non-homologous end joining protein LigD
MRLRHVKEPFDNPDYIFELKHDGFRVVVYLQNSECKLVSRNQRSLGFSELKKALASLPVQSAILDGEIVCLDSRGVSQFNALLERKGHAVLYAFDLLWHDGQDLRIAWPGWFDAQNVSGFCSHSMLSNTVSASLKRFALET